MVSFLAAEVYKMHCIADWRPPACVSQTVYITIHSTAQSSSAVSTAFLLITYFVIFDLFNITGDFEVFVKIRDCILKVQYLKRKL